MIGWQEFIHFGAASVALWSLGAGLALRYGSRRTEPGSANGAAQNPGSGGAQNAGNGTAQDTGSGDARSAGSSRSRNTGTDGAKTPGKGTGTALPEDRAPARAGSWIFLAGTLVFGVFIALFWYSLGRAPMRTMGETRLWYALFLTLTGWVLHRRWRYRFLLPFAAVLASVFTILDMLRPEIQSRTLMPALQSAWFVPHVAVYMLAYAVLAAALAVASASLFRRPGLLADADRLTRIGSALLILGMLSGSVWARQAWGDYWAWDAKECWAAATWLLTLTYIHFRLHRPAAHRTAVALLLAAFLALQVTWYGVNYLPAAKKSLHTYTSNR